LALLTSGAKVIASLLNADATLLRTYIIGQPPDYRLFHVLLQRLVAEPELGVRMQLAEALRVLLDTEQEDARLPGRPPPPAPTPQQTVEREDFLNVFYSHCISDLLGPFNQTPPTGAAYLFSGR
jgi:protein phosphatase-4 regulatory subunit 3